MKIPYLNLYKPLIIATVIIGLFYLFFVEKKLSLKAKIISLPILLMGPIGARTFFVIENYKTVTWKEALSLEFTYFKGYGAFVFVMLTTYSLARTLEPYLKNKDETMTYINEIIIKFFLIGGMFSKVGCFFKGCCKGKTTTLPWAIYREYDITRVHPSEIYDILSFATGLILMCALKGKISDEKRIAISLMAYIILRGLVEATYYKGQLFGSTFMRIVYLITIIICMYYCLKRESEK